MKNLDIIVFGATSFVGKIVCQYLHQLTTSKQHHQQNSITWGIAGRSTSKLKQLHSSLALDNNTVPFFIADANNEASLKSLCNNAKLIISTVGPYALHGELIVKVCAASGTDYCDLTGEPQFISKMLQRYEKIAQITGARLIHSCGFDSVPSDLGVWFTQQQSLKIYGSICSTVAMRVLKMTGAASGGTISSMLNIAEQASGDPLLRQTLLNPFALCPTSSNALSHQNVVDKVQYDPQLQGWIAPFIMATINEKIVHRSNALLDYCYTEQFRYSEALFTGAGLFGNLKAGGITVATKSFMLAAALAPSRWLMQQTFLPKPGEGPSLEQQKQGGYTLGFFGQTKDGDRLVCQVSGDQDPGYGSTSKILSQCAICLVKDIPKQQLSGGFWTPASAMAAPLLERLRRYSGMSFEVTTPR